MPSPFSETDPEIESVSGSLAAAAVSSRLPLRGVPKRALPCSALDRRAGWHHVPTWLRRRPVLLEGRVFCCFPGLPGRLDTFRLPPKGLCAVHGEVDPQRTHAASRTELSETPKYPKTFKFVLGGPERQCRAHPDGRMEWYSDPGPTVVFTRVEGARYRAALGGEPRPIRRVRVVFDQSETGRYQKYEPELESGEEVDLTVMATCVKLRPGTDRITNGIELRAADNWGHFRQWKFYVVKVTLGDDGAIEVLEDLGEMDGSYY